jgi:hypothetical protein
MRFGRLGTVVFLCVPFNAALYARAEWVPLEDRPTCSVPVGIEIESSLSSSQLDTIQSELRRIWEPYGVKLHSQEELRRALLTARSVRVVIGDIQGAIPPDVESTTNLGGVVFHGVAPRNILYASLDGVRQMLRPAMFRGVPFTACPRTLQDHLVARALGRTLAHELGHFLLAARQHTRRGLMRPIYSWSELLAADVSAFRLEPTQIAMLYGAGWCTGRDPAR